MAVKIYKNGNFHLLAGAKVYHNGMWKTMSAIGKVYLNNSWNYLGYVSSGVTITNGQRIVSSGCGYIDTVVNSEGSLYIAGGGIADNITLNNIGDIDVDGGTANNITINGGFMSVNSGIVNNITVYNSIGYISIHGESVANNIVLNLPNTSNRYSPYMGGTVNNITIEHGFMDIHGGGTANSITVKSGCTLYNSGCTLNKTTVNSKGLFVTWATANNTIVSTGGSMCVYISGMANNTTVNSGGSLYVCNEFSTISDTIINAGGYMEIDISGHAKNTTVNSGGSLYISRKGVANNVIVNSGAYLYVLSGGIAYNVTSKPGANISVNRSATITYA